MDKLDGKNKQHTLRETRWFSRLGPFKTAFPAIVSALEYYKPKVTQNQAIIYLPFCYLTLFCLWFDIGCAWMPNLDSTFWDISVYKTLHDEALDMNARQFGPRTTRLVSEDKSARKRGQVGP